VTERLYYHDPSLLTFDAVVTRFEEAEGRFLVYLDRSAFYPTSGGQSHDLGSLDDIAVVDVVETGDGDVAHVIASAGLDVGDRVHGIVEARRRLKNRQQHTAQHILSQLFVQRLGAETLSVHLGNDYGAVEIEASVVSDAIVQQVENDANGIVAANQPIDILFAQGEELAGLPLRKPPQRDGLVRVIRIGNLDWSACGGTHCNSTAEVGTIKIVGAEKIRGHASVKFLVGEQANADYRMRLEITDELSKALTCHPTDLIVKVEKLVSDNKNLRRELAQLQKELLPVRARDLASRPIASGRMSLVAEEIADIDSGLIGALTSMVAQETGGLAMLISGGRMAIAAAESTGIAADQLAREFCHKVGLKGGGNSRVAQIGGADPKRFAEYRDILISLVKNA